MQLINLLHLLEEMCHLPFAKWPHSRISKAIHLWIFPIIKLVSIKEIAIFQWRCRMINNYRKKVRCLWVIVILIYSIIQNNRWIIFQIQIINTAHSERITLIANFKVKFNQLDIKHDWWWAHNLNINLFIQIVGIFFKIILSIFREKIETFGVHSTQNDGSWNSLSLQRLDARGLR